MMKINAMVLGAALCFAAATASFAADPNVGTWKLNEAKSKIPAGASKNLTVVYTVAGDSYKCVVDGVDGAGKPTHNEWTGKFDGKDYAVTGDPTGDTRAYTTVNDRTLAMTVKKAGAVTMTGQIVVSADDKTRTVSTSGTDSNGKNFASDYFSEVVFPQPVTNCS